MLSENIPKSNFYTPVSSLTFSLSFALKKCLHLLLMPMFFNALPPPDETGQHTQHDIDNQTKPFFVMTILFVVLVGRNQGAFVKRIRQTDIKVRWTTYASKIHEVLTELSYEKRRNQDDFIFFVLTYRTDIPIFVENEIRLSTDNMIEATRYILDLFSGLRLPLVEKNKNI